MLTQALTRGILSILLLVAAWRAILVAVAVTSGNAPVGHQPVDLEQALASAQANADARFRLAVGVAVEQPTMAESILQESLASNPTHGQSLILWARLQEMRGEPSQNVEKAVESAIRLAPSNPWVLRQAAGHWAAQQQLDRALRYWSQAMIADPQVRKEIFPLLLALAETSDGLSHFEPLAREPPAWWENFFSRLANEAFSLDAVNGVYGLRRRSPSVPPTEKERTVYIHRLLKEGQTAQAYIEWTNGLDKDQLRVLGLLYNGGFEVATTNSNFDWRFHSTDRVSIRAERVVGAVGDKALRLMFRGYDKPFNGVSQSLFLDPGPYRLTGVVQIDKLKTLGGLRWQVRCTARGFDPGKALLAESERFLGGSEWRAFTLDFLVPETCDSQEIGLQSVGRDVFDWEMNGDIWFDAMTIRRRKEG
jgi:hypothetical protein